MVALRPAVLELNCWIGDYVAFYCYQDAATNTIFIYAPANTNLPSSTTFHITVESWRDPRLQPSATITNMIHDFTLLPTYAQYVSTPAMFSNVKMMEVHALSSVAIKKLWQFVNLAFNW